MTFAKAPWIAALMAVALLQTVPAKAETFNTCAGFIEALPAVISTQGVWCLKKDLSTSITSGNAISIVTNNVTIDCNGFKIGGLAGGNESGAMGIQSYRNSPDPYVLNTTVRNCAVRGFIYGIYLYGAGHLVEDNRLDLNLRGGIIVEGENGRVQRNAVYDTGGFPNQSHSFGIKAFGDVIDNTVAGVFGMATDTYPSGILADGSGSEIRGNRVRNLVVAGTGSATGISADGSGMTIADNRISAEVATPGSGILAYGGNTFCTGNTVVNFATNYASCEAIDGNLSLPSP